MLLRLENSSDMIIVTRVQFYPLPNYSGPCTLIYFISLKLNLKNKDRVTGILKVVILASDRPPRACCIFRTRFKYCVLRNNDQYLIFQVISLEGWTDIMYYVQDAHSFWDWIYFVLLIVVSVQNIFLYFFCSRKKMF